ncbi:MAG: gamma-glutamyl-phosphate reductase, partial [Desulfuromonadaceae bacterium]|nr:gamma-glutamyl-phosphate reductase [Desulfuromonadaceae bacterium]
MTITEQVNMIAEKARLASLVMAQLPSGTKNDMLLKMASALEDATTQLIAENRKDLECGEQKGLSPAMLDRLMLDQTRIKGIAKALREVAALDDPVGEITKMKKRPNDLMVGKMRIPLG